MRDNPQSPSLKSGSRALAINLITSCLALVCLISACAVSNDLRKDDRGGNKVASSEQRYLGSCGVDRRLYVTLTRYSTQDFYTLQFHVWTNVPDDLLQVWLLATNGSSLPPLGGGGGDVALGEVSALFDFKRTMEENALYGVLVRTGDDVRFYKMPRTIPGLSAEAQFTFDWLSTDFSTDDLESFETGQIPKPATPNSNWKSTANSIKSLKQQLLDEGVEVAWDRAQKRYTIKSIRQPSP